MGRFYAQTGRFADRDRDIPVGGLHVGLGREDLDGHITVRRLGFEHIASHCAQRDVAVGRIQPDGLGVQGQRSEVAVGRLDRNGVSNQGPGRNIAVSGGQFHHALVRIEHDVPVSGGHVEVEYFGNDQLDADAQTDVVPEPLECAALIHPGCEADPGGVAFGGEVHFLEFLDGIRHVFRLECDDDAGLLARRGFDDQIGMLNVHKQALTGLDLERFIDHDPAVHGITGQGDRRLGARDIAVAGSLEGLHEVEPAQNGQEDEGRAKDSGAHGRLRVGWVMGGIRRLSCRVAFPFAGS